MQKILKLQTVLADFVGALVMVIMLLIVIDVCGRYFFNAPLKGGIESSELMMTWLLFVPLAYGVVQNAHIRVTMLTMHLPPRLNIIVEIAGTVLSIAFFGAVTWVAWMRFWESFSAGEAMAASIWLPLWLQKMALPFGFFLFVVQLCVSMVVQIGKYKECSHGH
jgi:TRAP-type C4-dicarboxylate transport system permease small subunit